MGNVCFLATTSPTLGSNPERREVRSLMGNAGKQRWRTLAVVLELLVEGWQLLRELLRVPW